jgi:hypothetical protein
MRIIKQSILKSNTLNKRILFNQTIKRFAVITLLLGTLAFIPNVLFAQSPTIAAFSPVNGAIGSSITITGSGFNAAANQNIVFFGATQAIVTAASLSSLTVTVPIGATYQYLSVTNLAVNLTAYSAQPFIVTLAGNIAFANKQDFTTGSYPYSVSIGDIDGDGKPDLAVANASSNTVSVIRNTSSSGTISFAAKVDFTTGSYPISVSIGDIDGDGKPDLAVANYSSSTISVIRNTSTSGTVSFAAKVDFTTSTNPFSVSIGDIDGDGKPDLAVANAGSSTVSVLLNTSTSGTVHFAAKVDFTTGAYPESISIGDIDGDGKPDLAVANGGSNTVSVIRNTSTSGTVSFAAKVDFTTGTAPISVRIGDIDGDGKPDLAVANQSSNTVSVFLNTSTLGTISFASKVDFTTGATPVSVSIGDIDGDGKPDLAVVNNGTTTVSVFRNTSTSGIVSFAGKLDFTTGTIPHSVSIGDIDGDGKPDLAVANGSSNTVSVIRQITITITTFSPASGAIGSSVTITGTGFNATANQNIVFFGATQAIVTGASTTSLTVTVPTGATYQNISVTNLAVNLTAYSTQPFIVTLAGNIAFANKVDFTTGTQPYLVCIGDIDGDGKPDLAVANGSSNSISVFRNTSVAGIVSFAAKVDFATGAVPQSASIADIDGDGKPDLVVNNVNSNSVSVLRNTSTPGIISFAAKADFATGTGPSHPVSIGDLDGDGKPDLAVANYNSNTVSVFRNTSISGFVSFATKVDFGTGSQPLSATFGDIDGDGKSDLVVANHGSNTVSLFRNTSVAGTISFAARADFTTGTNPYSVSIGDIDGDGKPDLAVANKSSTTVSVFRNTSTSGAASFATKVDFATDLFPLSVSITDIDGDGKPDLAVANYNSTTVSVFSNTSTLGFINFSAKVDFTTGAGPYSVSIGDIDGDGKPDLAVTNQGANSVSIIRQITPVSITSFLPASGAIGCSVNITGTGFNSIANQNIVFFGATQATVTAASNTSLTVTVPVGATFQDISVTNLAVNLTAYSAQPFIVTLAGSIAFTDKVDFTTGSGPESASIGDIDGDGKPDLAVPNSGSNSISIFRNTSTLGITSFAAKVDFTTGTAPYSVCIADVDGDGKLDLAVTNQNSNTVSVFRNTSSSGIISFAAKVDFATSSGPLSVSFGDIDGDGKPDLAVANPGSATVSVFRNTSIPGTVSFATKADFTTGTSPFSVSIADIDGDGRSDLAVANLSSATVSVLRNTSTIGNVSFAPKADFTTGTSPYSVSIADLDGDGKSDLAVANAGSATVSVFLNTSISGVVSLAAKTDFTTDTQPFSVSITDINGDGKPDLAVANYGSSTVSILNNTSSSGAVSFASKVDFTTGTNPNSVSIADIDGDGKPDLAVANYASNTVSIILQEDLPQGSLTANGPFCSSGNGQLTWTATTGTGLFTVVYNDGVSNQTATNISSGTPFNVFINPVTSTTTYTLVSVSYPNNATRTSGFTGPSATITVNTAPTFTCPVNQTANTDVGLCTAAVSYSTSSVTGAPVPIFTYSFSGATTGSGNGTGSGSTFNNGVTTATLTATNTCGTATCSFSITVTDNINPTITAPVNASATTNTGCSATGVSIGTPTTGDNCSVASVTNDAPSIFALGNTIVTWTVTDGSGNTATATQTVTVTDNVNPTITAPADVNATTNTACIATGVTLGIPTTADNCSVASVINNAPASFPIGNTTVTWTVTDGSGNTANATQTITVTDNVNPTITAPADVNATTNTACTATGVTLGIPTTADNCSVADVTNNAPAAFPIGNTTVTWTVTDGSGNTATATQIITVTDNEHPTITAPAAINATTNTACTATGVTLGMPTTADNCSVASVTNNAPAAFPIGNTTVTWTVTDGSGNTATATQTITVTDNVNPTITAPADVNATTNTACTATGETLGNPTTADNCSVASVTNNAPAAFPIGNTTVTWTVTDGSGNSANATQTVIVTDNVNPTINAPADVNICSGTAVILGTPVTNDNCTVASVSNNHPSGNYPAGTTAIVWTVTDGSGNSATATQHVTINALPDKTTSVSGATITSNQAGASYQWLDCNNAMTPIPTATNQSYSATLSGNYAVVITTNSCNDTSACVSIIITGMDNLTNNNQIIIYPNPNRGSFIVKSLHEGTYSVVNTLGQTVQSFKLNASNNFTLGIENLSNGVYFILGYNNSELTRQRIIVTK